jgi:AAA domain
MTPQEFLAHLRPDNHVLTAIDPDRYGPGAAVSRHFERADDPDIAKFIAHAQAHGQGVYFTPNVPATSADKKPRKAEIARAEWVHADVDLPPDTDRDAGRAEVLARIRSALPFLLPEPLILDSGNGYQPLFRLAEPTTDFEAFEAVNRGLLELLGGDPGTFNTDRILRLPGTTNFPNAKKRGRGYKPVPASVVSVGGGPIPLAVLRDFVPVVAAPAEKADTRADVDYVEATRYASMSELPDGFRNRLLAALKTDSILGGLWLGQPAPNMHDPSGSGFRFAIAQHLHRAGGFTDTEIATAIWLCDYAGDQEKKTARALSRDVANSRPAPSVPRADPSDEFEIVGGEPERPTTRVLPAPIDLAEPIHPRRRIYSNFVTEGLVTAVVAPPGLGKSTWTLTHCLAIASGRALVGPVPVLRANVLVWNMEDAREDMARRVVAACRHYDVSQEDASGLFVLSGFDRGLKLGEVVEGTPRVSEKGFADLAEMIRRYDLKVVVLDPWISVHAMPENANTEIDMVAKRLAKLAAQHKIAVLVVHHTKKLGGHDATIEDSRGASALVGAVRSGVVLNPMHKDDAEKFNIANPHAFFRVDDAKQNFAARADKADWFQLVGVSLDNAEPPYPADNVGVIVPWAPIARAFVVEDEQFDSIREAMADEIWRRDVRAKGQWVGYAIGPALDLDPDSKTDRPRIIRALETLIEEGRLVVTSVRDAHRKTRDFVQCAPAEE